jgi:hypothetical protein
MIDRKSLLLRLPADVKQWIAQQAAKNMASQNSEIVRAIREQMCRICRSDLEIGCCSKASFNNCYRIVGRDFGLNTKKDDDQGTK